MTTKAQMPRTLLNFIRSWEAMRYVWRDMTKDEERKAGNSERNKKNGAKQFTIRTPFQIVF